MTVEFGPDRGQNLGTLFELTDADGKIVAGAGFQGVYNTYVRGERGLLQVFLRPGNRSAPWNIARLPAAEIAGAGFYPFGLDGQLYVYNGPRNDPRVARWNDGRHAWEIADDVRPRTQVIGGKRLQQEGERLVYDGVPLLDAAASGERLGEFYFAHGNLFVRQFKAAGEVRANRIAVYPWKPEVESRGLLPEQAEWSHGLANPLEFFYTFGQRQDQTIAITNVGTILRFVAGRWDELRESIPDVSYQVYCGVNFFDQLLLGHYPSGRMWEYAGAAPTPLADWPPLLKGVAPTARELQSAAIYGGDLYVGVWPWAEIWRYDTNQRQWSFVQRMFDHPEPSDKLQHPYEQETRAVDPVGNLWGQRVTGLAPHGESLFLTVSSKTGAPWDPKFSFLSPAQRSDYSAVHRATVPGNLAALVQWKPGPTTFEFALTEGRLTIHQDGQLLGELAVDADLLKDFHPTKIRWGQGVFGPGAASIVERSASLALASLPDRLRAAYLHPEREFKEFAAEADRRQTARRIVDQATRLRLNALFPYFTGSAGQAFYPSDVAPRSSFGPHDPLDELVRAAKSRGIKVYPVICTAVCGGERPAGVLLERTEWALRHPDGAPLGYLSPACPEARQWVVRVIEEIFDRFAPDGVVLDYIRFHNRPLRLDARAEENFEQSLPAECSAEERRRRLQTLKEQAVAAWVGEIAAAVRRKQPNAALGMYCWGPHTLKDHLTAQVWPTWIARGYADFVNVSGYYHRDKYGDQFLAHFERKLADAMALDRELPRHAALSYALGVNTSHGRVHSADEIRQYERSADKVGMPGVVFFSWSDLVPYLDELTAGCAGEGQADRALK